MQIVALIVDHIAVFIQLEGTSPGKGTIQVGQTVRRHEEAVALDGQIKGVVGELQRTLMELLRHRPRCHTVADLGLGIDEDGVGVDVRKLGTRLFKARGIDVGNVVGGNVQIFLCRVDTAQGIVK